MLLLQSRLGSRRSAINCGTERNFPRSTRSRSSQTRASVLLAIPWRRSMSRTSSQALVTTVPIPQLALHRKDPPTATAAVERVVRGAETPSAVRRCTKCTRSPSLTSGSGRNMRSPRTCFLASLTGIRTRPTRLVRPGRPSRCLMGTGGSLDWRIAMGGSGLRTLLPLTHTATTRMELMAWTTTSLRMVTSSRRTGEDEHFARSRSE
mmetsp:Transcript_36619/g.86102  ORF Transcript_36619/g.86102 Transcript_36619/m.86102 type:complete len:207 (+) Transcript_36619:189-809(+)